MNQDWPDPALARLFERQRDADRRATPAFARLCAPARSPRYRLRGRRLAHALAFAVGAVFATSPFWLRPREGALNPPPDSATRAPASPISISNWQAPTDALLQNYAAVSLTSPGTAWTDALISQATTPTGAAGENGE